MNAPIPPLVPDIADVPASPAGDWRRLPAQARGLFMVSGALAAIPAAIVSRMLAAILSLPFGWSTALGAAIVGGAIGMWVGYRRYRHTAWRLDADGFSLRKGRTWQSEIRVPVNRVQHLDVRRGPLERRYRLATLVIHTAGTRDSAVNVGGLADVDAEHLRDLLARQAEHDRAFLAEEAPRVPAADADDAPGMHAPTPEGGPPPATDRPHG